MCCHAGCPPDASVAAIGVRLADLLEPDPSRRSGHAPKTRRRGDGDENTRNAARRGDSVITAGDAMGGGTFLTARDAVAELGLRLGPRSMAWTYHDAAGKPVGLVVRWDSPTGNDVRPMSRKAASCDVWTIRSAEYP